MECSSLTDCQPPLVVLLPTMESASTAPLMPTVTVFWTAGRGLLGAGWAGWVEGCAGPLVQAVRVTRSREKKSEMRLDTRYPPDELPISLPRGRCAMRWGMSTDERG